MIKSKKWIYKFFIAGGVTFGYFTGFCIFFNGNLCNVSIL